LQSEMRNIETMVCDFLSYKFDYVWIHIFKANIRNSNICGLWIFKIIAGCCDCKRPEFTAIRCWHVYFPTRICSICSMYYYINL